MPLIKGTSVPAVAIFDDAGYSSVEELAHEYGVDPTTVRAVARLYQDQTMSSLRLTEEQFKPGLRLRS